MTRPATTRPRLRGRLSALGLAIALAGCAGTTSTGDATAADPPTRAETSASATTPTTDDPAVAESAADDAVATATPTPSTNATAAGSATADDAATPDYPTGITPARIVIPAIGVDAPIVELQLTADEAEVPSDFDDAGWWTQTREPGEIGPAVIGGHVDSTSGPAVFFRLEDLSVGDEITVEDEAGETRTFVVDTEPIRVRKDQRPPEVFGFGEGRPELRLITCGGDFDPTTGHYVDNVVVFAHQPGVEL